jgi:hypothetical protein
MKAVGKQLAKQWMDMSPHELRTWKNQLLLLLLLLLLVPKIGEMWFFDYNNMFDPLGHLLVWYLLVLVWHTKQFGQFKLLSISLHNATTTSWCIGVLWLLVLNKGFPNKQCVCCYQTWVKYIIYCSFPLQTGGRGKLQRLLMRTKEPKNLDIMKRKNTSKW